MNRDSVHSASLGGIPTAPLASLHPRPASDPGDDDSELGSDVAWEGDRGSVPDPGAEHVRGEYDVVAGSIVKGSPSLPSAATSCFPAAFLRSQGLQSLDRTVTDSPTRVRTPTNARDGASRGEAIACALPPNSLELPSDLTGCRVDASTFQRLAVESRGMFANLEQDQREDKGRIQAQSGDTGVAVDISGDIDDEDDDSTLGMVSVLRGYRGVSTGCDPVSHDTPGPVMNRRAGLAVADLPHPPSTSSSNPHTPMSIAAGRSAIAVPSPVSYMPQSMYRVSPDGRVGTNAGDGTPALFGSSGSEERPPGRRLSASSQTSNVGVRPRRGDGGTPMHHDSRGGSQPNSAGLSVPCLPPPMVPADVIPVTGSPPPGVSRDDRTLGGVRMHTNPGHAVPSASVPGANMAPELLAQLEGRGRPGSLTSSTSSAAVFAGNRSVPSTPGTPDASQVLWGGVRRSGPGRALPGFARRGQGNRSGGLGPLPPETVVDAPSSQSGMGEPPVTISLGGVAPGRPAPRPAAKDLSFLECVVELLKGTSCLQKMNLFSVWETRIWLSPDMSLVYYRGKNKKGHPSLETLAVSKVRKIKSNDREISILVDNEKKHPEFILPSREQACIWLSGLCCLVPTRASIKSRYKTLSQNRENYDPLMDTWNGKKLIDRKWFKQYILLSAIGRGAFAKVKLALSRDDRRFYAVKVLSKGMLRKQKRNPFDGSGLGTRTGLLDRGAHSGLEGELNEVRVMRHLDHKNIVKLLDTYDDVDSDRLFIVLEFVARGPVMNSSKLTGAKPMDARRVRSVFLDVVDGLMYLHSSRIVHRDIKPENILMAGDETAKLSDFGSAKMCDDAEASDDDSLHVMRTTVGTPAFTAPELCLSEKSPPASAAPYEADIWSLGATLFYMLYGRAPFLAKSVFEMYDSICSKELEFPDAVDVPESAKSLLSKILVKSPKMRAGFSEILASEFVSESGSPRLGALRMRVVKDTQRLSQPGR